MGFGSPCNKDSFYLGCIPKNLLEIIAVRLCVLAMIRAEAYDDRRAALRLFPGPATRGLHPCLVNFTGRSR